ncbi:MAG: hypothetical protein K1060chlam5_01180 [Candidatus Anoxychlamydiales bacterium]|nr:hypothetical protein [Candidatus Anoxychlamydiales bacterium]
MTIKKANEAYFKKADNFRNAAVILTGAALTTAIVVSAVTIGLHTGGILNISSSMFHGTLMVEGMTLGSVLSLSPLLAIRSVLDRKRGENLQNIFSKLETEKHEFYKFKGLSDKELQKIAKLNKEEIQKIAKLNKEEIEKLAKYEEKEINFAAKFTLKNIKIILQYNLVKKLNDIFTMGAVQDVYFNPEVYVAERVSDGNRSQLIHPLFFRDLTSGGISVSIDGSSFDFKEFETRDESGACVTQTHILNLLDDEFVSNIQGKGDLIFKLSCIISQTFIINYIQDNYPKQLFEMKLLLTPSVDNIVVVTIKKCDDNTIEICLKNQYVLKYTDSKTYESKVLCELPMFVTKVVLTKQSDNKWKGETTTRFLSTKEKAFGTATRPQSLAGPAAVAASGVGPPE